ncbi:MAG: PqqD family protein [Elusimicrobia bacterium]|nr:PqqD family protein [Elusimicrobiota bacterium]
MTDDKITKNPDVTWREVDGEAVLLNLENDYYYSMNEIGTKIWAMLNKGKTQKQIIAAIMEEFDADKKQVELDIKQFIKDMKKEDIIR